ncbi:hypothetical protein JS84_24725 [Vibrio vulnificus]|nr:hypothetical protein JS84_24725 [Vibrio vulnificus]
MKWFKHGNAVGKRDTEKQQSETSEVFFLNLFEDVINRYQDETKEKRPNWNRPGTTSAAPIAKPFKKVNK